MDFQIKLNSFWLIDCESLMGHLARAIYLMAHHIVVTHLERRKCSLPCSVIKKMHMTVLSSCMWLSLTAYWCVRTWMLWALFNCLPKHWASCASCSTAPVGPTKIIWKSCITGVTLWPSPKGWTMKPIKRFAPWKCYIIWISCAYIYIYVVGKSYSGMWHIVLSSKC